MRTIEIIIKGKVQGVGFRYHTRKIANELNIRGFVKNMYDGSVYIHAHGAEQEIEMFINWCRQGPRLAIVDFLELKEIPDNDFDGFTVQ
jgi:acylphosphatase